MENFDHEALVKMLEEEDWDGLEELEELESNEDKHTKVIIIGNVNGDFIFNN